MVEVMRCARQPSLAIQLGQLPAGGQPGEVWKLCVPSSRCTGLHLLCRIRVPHLPPPCLPAQVRASGHPGAARLPAIQGAPAELQQLVWDCTAQNRRERPTAGQAAERLEALLATL